MKDKDTEMLSEAYKTINNFNPMQDRTSRQDTETLKAYLADNIEGVDMNTVMKLIETFSYDGGLREAFEELVNRATDGV